MSRARQEVFWLFDATFRYTAITVMVLVLLKLLFHPAILVSLNLSVLVIGIMALGATRAVFS